MILFLGLSLLPETLEKLSAETTNGDFKHWHSSPSDYSQIENWHNQDNFIKLKYQFVKEGASDRDGGNERIMLLLKDPVRVTHRGCAISFWVRGDQSMNRLYFIFRTANGKQYVDISSEGPQLFRTINYCGWKRYDIYLGKDYFMNQGRLSNKPGIWNCNEQLFFQGVMIDDMGLGISRSDIILGGFVTNSIAKNITAVEEHNARKSNYSGQKISIKITSNKTGNLSFGSENLVFKVQVDNNGPVQKDFVLKIQKTNFFNSLIEVNFRTFLG